MKLVFISHDRKAYQSNAKAVTLGSGPNANVAIDSPGVQSEQSRIIAAGKKYYLEDLGGDVTTLNGRPVEGRTELANSDLITIGDVKMRVQELPSTDDGDMTKIASMPTDKIDKHTMDGTQVIKTEAQKKVETPKKDNVEEKVSAKTFDPNETFHGEVNIKDINPHKLLVYKNDEFLREYPLTQKETLIGNGSLADLKLDSDLIARRHVKMIMVSSGVNLEALSDELKIYVNGEAIARSELVSKDIISLGDIKLIYMAPGAVLGKDEIQDILKDGVIKAPKSRKKFFRIIIGLLGFIVLMLLIGLLSGAWEEKPQRTAAPQQEAVPESVRIEIQELINDRDWDGALKLIKAKGTGLEDKARLFNQVKMEVESRQAFVQVQEDAGKEQWEKAAESSRNIPVDSVYFLMMRKLFSDRTKKFTKDTFSSAKYLAGRKKTWDEAMKKLRLVLQLDPDNKAARRLYEKLDRRTKTKVIASSDDDTEEMTEAMVSFFNEFEAGQKLFLDGNLDEALAKLKSLGETITGADAQVMSLPETIKNLEMTIHYFNLGIKARNSSQQLEAINDWEKMLGPAGQVYAGRIPVKIAKVRDEIIQYYLPRAKELLSKKKVLESASLFKRILLYDPGNVTALEGIGTYEPKAKAYLEKGKLVRTDHGCQKAETYFQMAMDLTDESNQVYQDAIEALADCAK